MRGTTPAHTPAAMSSSGSSDQPSPILSDHVDSEIRRRSAAVAASSFRELARSSATRPGMNVSVSVSRYWTLSSAGMGSKAPKMTALWNWNDDSNPLRATSTPSSVVTAMATGAPAATSRSQGEPVEPWMTSSSPIRANPMGNISGCPSRTSAIVASGVLSSSSSS